MKQRLLTIHLLLILVFFGCLALGAEPPCDQSSPVLSNVSKDTAVDMCKIQCEKYFQENPDARPKSSNEICSRLRLTVFKLMDPVRDIRLKLACAEGAFSGSIEGLKDSWDSAVELYESTSAHMKKRAEWQTACAANIECRRALARQFPPNHEKDSDGSYKISDAEVDKKWLHLDTLTLEKMAEKGRLQRASACAPQVRSWLEKNGENVEQVAKSLSNPYDDCLKQYVFVLVDSQSGPKINLLDAGLQWLTRLGIKAQCYSEEDFERLQCAGIAGFLTDPTVLIPSGVGVAAKAIKIARIRRAATLAARAMTAEARTSAEAGVVPKAFRELNTHADIFRALSETKNGKTLAEELGQTKMEKLKSAIADVHIEDSKIFAAIVNELSESEMESLIKKLNAKLGLPVGSLNREAMDLAYEAYANHFAARAGSGTKLISSIDESVIASARRADKITDFSEVPHVNLNQVEGRRVLSRTSDSDEKLIGTGFLQVQRGRLNGQDVFIKVSRAEVTPETSGRATRTAADVLNEAKMYTALNNLNLGPRFHGVTTQTIEGRRHLAIVTDFVEGQEISARNIGIRGRITQQMIDDIRNAGRRLSDAGISVGDLQFRITPSGRAVVIDPEEFRFVPRGTSNALDVTEGYARQLQSRMLLQGNP